MKIYVAGPDVFRTDAEAHADKIREILTANGLTPLLPIDNEVDGKSKHPSLVAMEIYAKNVAMIDQADAVIANIEPFRGPHMDPGTAFEIGYAICRGKPVYCYTSYADTALVDRTEWREADGQYWDNKMMSIENFGQTENLMITSSAQSISNNLGLAVLSLIEDLVQIQETGEEHA